MTGIVFESVAALKASKSVDSSGEVSISLTGYLAKDE
jgi:hypothetical protein